MLCFFWLAGVLLFFPFPPAEVRLYKMPFRLINPTEQNSFSLSKEHGVMVTRAESFVLKERHSAELYAC